MLVWLSLAPLWAQPLEQKTTLDLGDFQAQAEFTLPAQGDNLPIVVLVHGSGPSDMDASTYSYWGGKPKFHSAVFAQMAEELPKRGVAVLRYHKHYVSGTQRVDTTSYSEKLTLQRLVEDVKVAMKTARAHPRTGPVFVLGLSEGSAVAMEAALTTKCAGFIGVGSVLLDWRQGVTKQIRDLGIPYLKRFATDNRLSMNELTEAVLGDGTPVEKAMASYLAEPTGAWTWRFRSLFDADQDGAVHLRDEVEPKIEEFLDGEFSETGYFRMFRTGHALPTVAQQKERILARALPVLLLHGEYDANCPADAVREMGEQLNRPLHKVIIYPQCGHTLGIAKSRADDHYRPMETSAISDLADWIWGVLRVRS